MKNKGFTLVELLAVIVIIGIIALIATPNILGVLNSSRNSLTKSQEIELENAARAWGLQNVYVEEKTPTPNSVKEITPVPEKVTISKIKEDGYLENKNTSLKNVGEKAGYCISYKNEQLKYEYCDNTDNCSNGKCS